MARQMQGHRANAVVRARINQEIKDEAAAVLAAMGLTVSEAFRMLLIKIAKEKVFPFEPLSPNLETVEAMRATRRGDVIGYKTAKALFDDLNDNQKD